MVCSTRFCTPTEGGGRCRKAPSGHRSGGEKTGKAATSRLPRSDECRSEVSHFKTHVCVSVPFIAGCARMYVVDVVFSSIRWSDEFECRRHLEPLIVYMDTRSRWGRETDMVRTHQGFPRQTYTQHYGDTVLLCCCFMHVHCVRVPPPTTGTEHTDGGVTVRPATTQHRHSTAITEHRKDTARRQYCTACVCPPTHPIPSPWCVDIRKEGRRSDGNDRIESSKEGRGYTSSLYFIHIHVYVNEHILP